MHQMVTTTAQSPPPDFQVRLLPGHMASFIHRLMPGLAGTPGAVPIRLFNNTLVLLLWSFFSASFCTSNKDNAQKMLKVRQMQCLLIGLRVISNLYHKLYFYKTKTSHWNQYSNIWRIGDLQTVYNAIRLAKHPVSKWHMPGECIMMFKEPNTC